MMYTQRFCGGQSTFPAQTAKRFVKSQRLPEAHIRPGEPFLPPYQPCDAPNTRLTSSR